MKSYQPPNFVRSPAGLCLVSVIGNVGRMQLSSGIHSSSQDISIWMLWLAGRGKPSIACVVQPGNPGGFQKVFFGREEVAIPLQSRYKVLKLCLVSLPSSNLCLSLLPYQICPSEVSSLFLVSLCLSSGPSQNDTLWSIQGNKGKRVNSKVSLNTSILCCMVMLMSTTNSKIVTTSLWVPHKSCKS